MDWSRAKTIFIITFLILDIFLVIQIINQKNENTYDMMSESTVDEQLKAEEIVLNELPEGSTEEYYIEADSKKFELDDLDKISGQTITVPNEYTLTGQLEDPYPLGDDWKPSQVDQFVFSNIYKGTQYKYWNYNATDLTITYYQQFNNKTFYKNAGSQLVLQLNDEDEIISYKQTMLDNIEENKKQQILSAHDAIVALYKRRLLPSGSEITKVELGYYTLIPIKTSQLLAPTWRITINGTTDYFVNAVEGHIFNEESKVVQ